MAIDTIITCPLGSKCEEIRDNKLHRCMWYTCLAGMNPQTGEQIDEWKCAMSWIPIMLVENANTNRGQTAAIESMRNEQVKRQDLALEAMMQLPVQKLIEIN